MTFCQVSSCSTGCRTSFALLGMDLEVIMSEEVPVLGFALVAETLRLYSEHGLLPRIVLWCLPPGDSPE